MNSRGLSVVMRSEAHGSKTIPVPTLKGSNHVNVGYRLCSTPSGSDVSADCSPVWRLPARHTGLSILVPSGDLKLKPSTPVSSDRLMGNDDTMGEWLGGEGVAATERHSCKFTYVALSSHAAIQCCYAWLKEVSAIT